VSHGCQEIAAYTRACERLLCKEGTMNEDERNLLDYREGAVSGISFRSAHYSSTLH
jgi:hypothetical protein